MRGSRGRGLGPRRRALAATLALGAAVDLDAVTWTRSPSDPPGAGNIAGLATNGTRFVLTGLAIQPVDGFVPIWTSADGVKWIQAAGPTAGFPSGVVVSLVTCTHGKFFAFGQLSTSPNVLAWTSTDSVRWKPYEAKGFPPAPGNVPVAVAPTKSGLVLQTLEDGSTYHVWSLSSSKWRAHGDVPGVPDAVVSAVVPGKGAAKYLAAGSASGVAAWNSKNGATWSPATITGPNPAKYEAINHVVTGGPGFVSVGVVNSAAGSEVAYAWSSKDGKKWTAKDSPAFAATSGSSSGMEAATASGKRVFVAGHDGGALALWSSPNGTAWKRAADQPAFQIKSGTIAQAAGIVVTKSRVVAIFRERSYNASSGRFVLNGVGIVSGKLAKK